MMITILEPDFEFGDERGSLVQLVHAGYSQVNVVRSQKGTERGGHLHRDNVETFYVVEGAFLLRVWRGTTEETYEFTSGAMFRIERGVAHSFFYREDTILVALYDRGVEKEGEKDIVPVRPIGE